MTHNIISVSGGNDSKAMLLTIRDMIKKEPNLFADEDFTAIHCDTGWARDGWESQITTTKQICEDMGIEFVRLTATVINRHIKNDTDKMFESLPYSNRFGMVAMIKKKKAFPNLKFKYCTEYLKIKPIQDFMKSRGFNPKNSVQWIGIRCEEGGRLGGRLGSNKKDRSHTTSTGSRNGFDVVFPICYLTEVERDKLLKKNNIEVYPNRSEECYPCIYQCSKEDLANLDPERVTLISNLETKINKYTHSLYDLLDKDENPNQFYGMFNPNKCGGAQGIVEQQKWAKKELEKQGDDWVINDKCKSGYCGT